MTTRQNRRALLLLLAVAVAAPVGAAERRKKPLTAQDYAEIQQLYARYHWIADAGDGKAWATLFTSDGEYSQEGGSNKAKGREQLTELGIKAFGSVKSGLRFTTNIRLEPSPEGARGGAYLLSVTPGEAGKPASVTVMVYEDVLAKTSEGWRFKSRRTYLSDPGLAPSRILQSESAR
jgi:hypothetical protein